MIGMLYFSLEASPMKLSLLREGEGLAAAVVTPLTSFLDNFLETQAERLAHLPPEDYGRAYQIRFIDLVIEKQHLLRAYYAAGSPVGGDEPHAVFQDYLAQAAKSIVDKMRQWGFPPLEDPWLTARLSFATYLAVVMFDEWLFPPGERPDTSRIVDELVAYHFHGIGHRAGGKSLARTPDKAPRGEPSNGTQRAARKSSERKNEHRRTTTA